MFGVVLEGRAFSPAIELSLLSGFSP